LRFFPNFTAVEREQCLECTQVSLSSSLGFAGCVPALGGGLAWMCTQGPCKAELEIFTYLISSLLRRSLCIFLPGLHRIGTGLDGSFPAFISTPTCTFTALGWTSDGVGVLFYLGAKGAERDLSLFSLWHEGIRFPLPSSLPPLLSIEGSWDRPLPPFPRISPLRRGSFLPPPILFVHPRRRLRALVFHQKTCARVAFVLDTEAPRHRKDNTDRPKSTNPGDRVVDERLPKEWNRSVRRKKSDESRGKRAT